MRILQKVIIALLTVGVIPVLFVMVLNYYSAKELIMKQTLNMLDSIASDHEFVVNSFIDGAVSRHTLIASRMNLRSDLEEYNATGDRQRQGDMNAILKNALAALGMFEEVYIADPNGVIVAGTDIAQIGVSIKGEDFFVKGQKAQSFDAYAGKGEHAVHIITAGPLFSPAAPDKFLGVLVVEENPKMLNDIVNNYAGLGNTGESFLAKRNVDGDALFITNSRLDPNAAFRRVISKDNERKPINKALNKEDVIMTDAVDYFENPIIGVSRYIDKAGWGLVVNIHRSEALAPIDELFLTALLLLSIVIIFIIVMGFIFTRLLVRPIVRLTATVNEISRGKLDVQIDKLDTKDEVGELARAFERVLVSLKLAMKEMEKPKPPEEEVKK